MNHSCSPNTTNQIDEQYYSKGIYKRIAVKNIQPGEEIICNMTITVMGINLYATAVILNAMEK